MEKSPGSESFVVTDAVGQMQTVIDDHEKKIDEKILFLKSILEKVLIFSPNQFYEISKTVLENSQKLNQFQKLRTLFIELFPKISKKDSLKINIILSEQSGEVEKFTSYRNELLKLCWSKKLYQEVENLKDTNLSKSDSKTDAIIFLNSLESNNSNHFNYFLNFLKCLEKQKKIDSDIT